MVSDRETGSLGGALCFCSDLDRFNECREGADWPATAQGKMTPNRPLLQTAPSGGEAK